MMAELFNDLEFSRLEQSLNDTPKYSLPGTRCEIGATINSHERSGGQGKRTISTNPQNRTILFPLLECVALEKPACGAFVLGVTGSIVID